MRSQRFIAAAAVIGGLASTPAFAAGEPIAAPISYSIQSGATSPAALSMAADTATGSGNAASLPRERAASAAVAQKLALTRSAAMKWELAYLALSAVDAAQTIECLDRGACHEANPLFGKHPKAGTLIAAKAGLGLVHFLAFRHINRRNPKAALRLAQISAGVQGGVVLLNARMVF